MAGRWLAWPGRAGGRHPIPGTPRSQRCARRRPGQELAKARFVVEVQAKPQALLA
jgi:hypothetical protein